MNVLVFNCGSSSLKYKLMLMPEERELAGGEAQRVGPKTAEPSRIIHKEKGKTKTFEVEMPNHAVAFQRVLELLNKRSGNKPDVLGHRVVHGAHVFGEHVVIDETVIEGLKKTLDLAPLHNPPAVALIEACHQLYPDLPQVAVFDTAYHSTIPWHARTYVLPAWLRRKYSIRKYGFHGTSHQFVAAEAAEFLGLPLGRLDAVSCHLGSGGASLCAIMKGRSVDNTMGFSPLPGLLMSTRCGDLDPSVTLKLLASSGGNIESVERILNKESGVLGLSGLSADIRDVLKQKGKGKSDWHELATQIYFWRLKKLLGSYLAVVGRPQAVIFTDTIGETVPAVREAACTGMDSFGLCIDAKKNKSLRKLPADVASVESKIRILVIQTNEELAIARRTASLMVERGKAREMN